MVEDISMIFKTLSIAGAALGGGTAGWTWYDRNRRDKKLDSIDLKINAIDKQQTEHENKFITEQRTRDIFREEVAPLRDDVLYIKTSISEMRDGVNQLSKELAISNAVSEALKDFKGS